MWSQTSPFPIYKAPVSLIYQRAITDNFAIKAGYFYDLGTIDVNDQFSSLYGKYSNAGVNESLLGTIYSAGSFTGEVYYLNVVDRDTHDQTSKYIADLSYNIGRSFKVYGNYMSLDGNNYAFLGAQAHLGKLALELEGAVAQPSNLSSNDKPHGYEVSYNLAPTIQLVAVGEYDAYLADCN
jgi:hypothetical protein